MKFHKIIILASLSLSTVLHCKETTNITNVVKNKADKQTKSDDKKINKNERLAEEELALSRVSIVTNETRNSKDGTSGKASNTKGEDVASLPSKIMREVDLWWCDYDLKSNGNNRNLMVEGPGYGATASSGYIIDRYVVGGQISVSRIVIPNNRFNIKPETFRLSDYSLFSRYSLNTVWDIGIDLGAKNAQSYYFNNRDQVFIERVTSPYVKVTVAKKIENILSLAINYTRYMDSSKGLAEVSSVAGYGIEVTSKILNNDTRIMKIRAFAGYETINYEGKSYSLGYDDKIKNIYTINNSKDTLSIGLKISF